MTMNFFPLVFVLCIDIFLVSDATRDSQEDAGKPLYLTLLLEQSKIHEAQEKSRVRPDFAGLSSYSGYFTVNQTCESNLFFWFFPAQENWEKAPLILWLQGGPGVSFMVNLFEELGPLTYREKVGRRQNSWNIKNNLLFIDQPVGTGFSFTGKDCFAKDETTVGNELYLAVLQFIKLFPQLKNNKFYIAGHSYAGHFIPALGHTIHQNNPSAKTKINLVGMMIGNGWMDAFYQYDLGTYLYQLGLIDDNQQEVYYQKQEKFLDHMRKQEWESALQLRAELAITMFQKDTGNVSDLNYLEDRILKPDPYESLIIKPQVRKSIHVGNTSFLFYNAKVDNNMGVDPVLSVKPWVEELLQHYFIVFYTGQLDITCAYPQIVNFQRNLNWEGNRKFKNASRKQWCVDGRLVGYFKGANNLYDVLIRRAGHRVSFDQPQLAFILANAVASGPTSNPLQGLEVCPLPQPTP